MTTGVDFEAVSEWIGGLGIGAIAPLSFDRVGNGQSNLTYAVTDAGGSRWVLRRPPLGSLLASAHDVVREYRILTALQNTGVPVPKMIAVCEDLSVSEVPLVLMSFVDGVVIDSVSTAEKMTELQSGARWQQLSRTFIAWIWTMSVSPISPATSPMLSVN